MKEGKLRLKTHDEELFFGDGQSPYAELVVKDETFFKQVVLYGDVGLGESYMEGLWDTPDLTKLVSWFIRNIRNLPGMSGGKKAFNPLNMLKITNRIGHILRANTRKGARANIAAHYDLNNDFFKLFLDPSMTYSSGLFLSKDQSLEEAQSQKYQSLCNSMKITKSDHVLEIGCGWGGFAEFVAKKFGCHVTAITISKEQYNFALKRIEKAGLSERVNILLKDYRDIGGQFNKVVSIEMIEAVGHRYFKPYFNKIEQVLAADGVLGLQAIIIPDNRYDDYRKSIDWTQKHIFPGGLLPSIKKINETINSVGNLNLFSVKDMGKSYAQTLKNWHQNFEKNLEQVKQLGFDSKFIKKWEYYLCSCEASFLERNINVVQIVYARPNNPGF